jgi:hypothetical protein
MSRLLALEASCLFSSLWFLIVATQPPLRSAVYGYSSSAAAGIVITVFAAHSMSGLGNCFLNLLKLKITATGVRVRFCIALAGYPTDSRGGPALDNSHLAGKDG